MTEPAGERWRATYICGRAVDKSGFGINDRSALCGGQLASRSGASSASDAVRGCVPYLMRPCRLLECGFALALLRRGRGGGAVCADR